MAASAAPEPPAENRILGTSLVELGADVVDRGLSNLEYGAHVFGQIPLGRYVEASVTYGHLDWHQTFGFLGSHEIDDALAGTVAAYYHMDKFTPFIGVGVQRTWWSIDYVFEGEHAIRGNGHADIWDVFSGVEVPFRRWIVTAGARYTDELHPVSNFETSAVMDYSLEIHRWLSRRVGAFAGFDRSLPRAQFFNPSIATTLYVTGVRLRL